MAPINATNAKARGQEKRSRVISAERYRVQRSGTSENVRERAEMNIGPPSSSSTSADRSDGPPASLREALRAGELSNGVWKWLRFEEIAARQAQAEDPAGVVSSLSRRL